MNVVVCTRDDLKDGVVPLDTTYLDEQECVHILRSIGRFFRPFLDRRPYQRVGELSGRAQTILQRQHAKTIGDVARLLVQAKSNQGVPGAGKMVQKEWASLVR